MKYPIRLADENDLERLIQVGDKLFDHDIKPNRTKEFFEDSRHHLAIALDDEKVVGFASGVHYVHPDKDPSMFINEVSVLEEYQNQGIGRAVVKFMVEHVKAIGCHEAWIATEVSNKPAIRCYLGAGGKKDEEPFESFVWEGL